MITLQANGFGLAGEGGLEEGVVDQVAVGAHD